MTLDKRKGASEALGSCALATLAVAMSVAPFSSGAPGRFGAPQLILLLVYVAAVLGAAEAFVSRRVLRLPWQLGAPILVFLACVLFSIARASYLYPALLTGAQWFAQALLFFLLLQFLRRPAQGQRMLALLVAVASASAAYAIYQYFFGLQFTRDMLTASPELILSFPPDLRAAFDGRAFRTTRAFGTFVTPNSLAGFLVLLWPSALAYAIWIFGGRARWWAGPAAGFSAAVILVAALLTKSKGGWVALAASVFVFALLYSGGKPRRVLLFLGSAGLVVAALMAALGLSGAVKFPPLQNYAASLAARLGYWRAAAAMIKDSLPFGIGLEGFGYQYLAYKPASAHEGLYAHNDYLQIWAEMGTAGFAVWVCIWIAYFWSMLRRRKSETAITQDAGGPYFSPIYVFVPAALLAGYLAIWLLSLFFIIWLVCFWPVEIAIEEAASASPSASKSLGRLARIGAVSGLAAFLVHSLADLNNYVPAIGQTAWALMAVSLAAGGRENAALRRPSLAAASLLGVGFLTAALTLGTFSMRELRARAADQSASTQAKLAFEMYGNGKHPEALARLHLAIARFKTAERMMPFSAETVRKQASLYGRLWAWGQEYFSGRSTFEEAAELYRKASRLSPANPTYRSDLARLYRERAAILPRRASPWFENAREAVRLYPANPRYHLELGDAAGAMGYKREQLIHYQTALELDAEVPHEWLRLSDADRARVSTELQRRGEPLPEDSAVRP